VLNTKDARQHQLRRGRTGGARGPERAADAGAPGPSPKRNESVVTAPKPLNINEIQDAATKRGARASLSAVER